MSGERLGVLLGADSLVGRRSGVGRMTLQIGRMLRGHSAIAGLSLMVGGRPLPATLLDGLGDEEGSLEPPPGQSGMVKAGERLGRFPGLPALRSAFILRHM